MRVASKKPENGSLNCREKGRKYIQEMGRRVAGHRVGARAEGEFRKRFCT